MQKAEIIEILKSNPENLHKMVREKVISDKSNKAGEIIYKHLTDVYLDQENPLTDKEYDILADILDGLTGYCAKPCWIGTGDYHIKVDNK